MSKKFKIGEFIGIIIGATIGIIGVHYITRSIFGPTKKSDAYQSNYAVGQPQFNQNTY